MSTIFRDRSTEAADSTRAKHVDKRIPGEGGTWIFILGEMIFFLLLFALYLFNRIAQPDIFRASQAELSVPLGVLYTLLLLVSSLMVVAGFQAIRLRVTTIAPWLLGGAAICGTVFVVLKFLEYSAHVGHGQTFSANNFWTYYYVLTAAHLVHVLIGLGFLAYMIVRSRDSDLDVDQLALLEGSACYWHMVDLIWIILFPLVYLMA